eukprot:5835552-Pleurochrysis_carterae.AAC.1
MAAGKRQGSCTHPRRKRKPVLSQANPYVFKSWAFSRAISGFRHRCVRGSELQLCERGDGGVARAPRAPLPPRDGDEQDSAHAQERTATAQEGHVQAHGLARRKGERASHTARSKNRFFSGVDDGALRLRARRM